MKILFIHNNFPGQYARIVNFLKGKPGIEMLSGSLSSNSQPAAIPRIGYSPHRAASDKTHPALRKSENCVLMGQAVYSAFYATKKRGWNPDIMLAHSGYGDSLFLKDLWPRSKYMPYLEWYYNIEGADVSFLEPDLVGDPNMQFAVRMKNTAFLQDMAAMDWGQCPTEFQKSQIPSIFHSKISVLHDGVDTEFFAPKEDATFHVNNLVFRLGDPLVTYVSRGMEPARGFPQFMEAVSILHKRHSSAHVVVIGEDKVAYGKKRTDEKTFLQWALEEFEIDSARFHFMGRQPLSILREAFQVSGAHIYLTSPFVLSWSMLEAMSAGALVFGSDTPPVREIITDGDNGLLVPFFEPERIAQRVIEALESPDKYVSVRRKARQDMINKYDARSLNEEYYDLIKKVCS